MSSKLPVTLLLTAFAVLAAMSSSFTDLLQFDRTLLIEGQIWRLVACHFTHWNLDHLFWDAAVFAGTGLICENRNRATYLTCLFASVVFIPAALVFLRPEMMTYRGLSGIDSALFALLASWTIQESWTKRNWRQLTVISVVAVGFAMKLGYEILTGSTFFVDSTSAGFVPIVEAHTVGAIIGIAAAFLPTLSRRSKPEDVASGLQVSGSQSSFRESVDGTDSRETLHKDQKPFAAAASERNTLLEQDAAIA